MFNYIILYISFLTFIILGYVNGESYNFNGRTYFPSYRVENLSANVNFFAFYDTIVALLIALHAYVSSPRQRISLSREQYPFIVSHLRVTRVAVYVFFFFF